MEQLATKATEVSFFMKMLLFINPNINVTETLTKVCPDLFTDFELVLLPQVCLIFNQESIVLRCGTRRGANFLSGQVKRILETLPCAPFVVDAGILPGTGCRKVSPSLGLGTKVGE